MKVVYLSWLRDIAGYDNRMVDLMFQLAAVRENQKIKIQNQFQKLDLKFYIQQDLFFA